jgi:hypothetical protein
LGIRGWGLFDLFPISPILFLFPILLIYSSTHLLIHPSTHPLTTR